MEEPSVVSESGAGGMLICRNSQGFELQGTLLKVERHRVVFEAYGPQGLLRTSEVLSDLHFQLSEREVYSGSAVVTTVVHAGTVSVCEARLNEGWLDIDFMPRADVGKQLGLGYTDFLKRWQKTYKISPEYKAIIGEAQIFLTDLRLWLEAVELQVRSQPDADRIELEQEVANKLRPQITGTLNNFFERFEVISEAIDDDLRAAHAVFGQRQLHPHLLCAPFIHRTYTKPLGYAGDYEMMNMIIRNRCEGGSLYAKVVNGYLLDQDAPEAVRNRVGFLSGRLTDETSRVARTGKNASIFCVACGPAWEIVSFLTEQPLADRADFQLLDFNEETLQYVGQKLNDTIKKHNRKTTVKLVKNSVQSLLRHSGNAAADSRKFDFIYCSGLYDYLTDRICKALNSYLYDLLQPNGLLLTGNFAPSTRCQNFMEHFSEWFLIYRDARDLMGLAPDQASKEHCRIISESTGSNIFLEVRKPA